MNHACLPDIRSSRVVLSQAEINANVQLLCNIDWFKTVLFRNKGLEVSSPEQEIVGYI